MLRRSCPGSTAGLANMLVRHNSPWLADARGVSLSLVASAVSAAMRARPLRGPVTHGHQIFGQTVLAKRRCMVTVDSRDLITKRIWLLTALVSAGKCPRQHWPAVAPLALSTLTCTFHRLTHLWGMLAALLSPKNVLPRTEDSAWRADVHRTVSVQYR